MNADSPKDVEVQATVQQLLLDQGRYAPVELLLATDQLRPEDYQAWLRGERARLDDAFAGGPRGARECLEAAAHLAEALGLSARRDVLSGSEENPEGDRVASSDPRLNELLRTSFSPRPPAQAGQLDLFLDSPITSTANALLDALWRRDAGGGSRACVRLAELAPEHGYLVSAAALIEMLETPSLDGVEQGLEGLGRLEEEWSPAASDLFGARGAEWLAPFWCEAGRALGRVPFDPLQPKRHASWAYQRGFAWKRLRRRVLETSGHEDEPVLLARLAEAEYRLRSRIRAVEHWFVLCRRAPEAFRKLIEVGDFPDSTVREAWHLAEDQDDLDPGISPAWFPAWMLLHEHGLARELSPCGGCSDPERAFDLLRALLTRPRAEEGSMELRRKLGAIHPGLLQRYLAKLEVRPPRR